jgi:hypothetical protein
MFPLPFAENFQITKSETVYETGPSGNKYKIKDGIRSFAFDLVDKNGSVRMLSQLKKFGCSDLVYFIVDIEGKIEGWKASQDEEVMHGFPMSNSTWNAILNYATDTTVQKIMVSFDQSQYFNDGQIYYLTPTDLGFSGTELKGLLSAAMTIGTITTTSVIVTVKKSNTNAVGTGTPIVGLLSNQFSIVNATTSAAVNITSATETAPGVYTLTYAAVVGTHTFKMNLSATGYDIPQITYVDPS